MSTLSHASSTVQPEAVPSLDELHSDQFVTLSAMPASEQAFAAEAFGWDAEDEQRNDDDLLSRYPGMADLPNDALSEIATSPEIGLMQDAADVVAVARIILRRRGAVAA